MTGALSTRPTIVRRAAAAATAASAAAAAAAAAPVAEPVEARRPRPHGARSVSLAELGEMIREVESNRRRGPSFTAIPTGWPPPFDRIARGVLHEWLCTDDGSPRAWQAPLLVFVHLAKLAWRTSPASAPCRSGALLVWIGRRAWPQPQALMGAGASSAEEDRPALHRSLLIDPASDAERLWAADLALRSPAVAAVMVDAGGLTLAQTRRLQLAAEHGGAAALLARRAREAAVPSAAALRWRIRPEPSPTAKPRWRIEAVRCKGVQRAGGTEAGATSLVLEHDRETGGLRVPAGLADR